MLTVADSYELVAREPATALAQPDAVCLSSNKCSCRKGTKHGYYCAACSEVTQAGSSDSWDHLFECNADTTCCDRGSNATCAGDAPTYPCGDRTYNYS